MSGDGTSPGATPWQTVGPFFHVGLAMQASGAATDTATRTEVRLRIRILDGDGRAVTDAVVEIWQAAWRPGSSQPDTGGAGTNALFGRQSTDEEGFCEFDTIRPDDRADAGDGARAAHVSVCLMARGLLRPLYTQIYFAGDPALAADAALALVPAARRHTLIAQPQADDPARWLFEIRLQGDDETVFFDV